MWRWEQLTSLSGTVKYPMFLSSFSYLAKDWWILAVGLVGAVLVGTSFPLFGIVFGEGLAVIFDSVDGT